MFKKGGPFDAAMYRPIAVMQLIAKLDAGILSGCIEGPYREGQGLREESRAGFRPGLSTMHQLFALQRLVAEAKYHGISLYARFVDLKGAYDSVQRPLLWQALGCMAICL